MLLMEPLIARLIVKAAPRATSRPVPCIAPSCRVLFTSPPTLTARPFSTSSSYHIKQREKPFDTKSAPDSSYSQPAADLSQNVLPAEKDHFSRVEAESKKRQTIAPWMREGSDAPPVTRPRSAGAMTKGRLLTTPSRMLKLILPLTTRDRNHDRKDVEPLALLVHPQQPLSYLERLIQSELPLMMDEKKDKERPPEITFRAQDASGEDEGEKSAAAEQEELEDGEETVVDGKVEKTGKISGGSASREKDKKDSRQLEREQDAARSDPEHKHFVRWSPSTEIGDFIRDAARGTEFAVDIEGAPEPIYVGVPSFADRTHYLRMRLRKISKSISTMADIKSECDHLAHQGAKRVAQTGFAGLIGWWFAVYWLTFRTDLGWDVMEPVTYLVGLSGLIGGYLWFLYHNREVSYRTAMHVTVSRRQNQLYELKGFNLPTWEGLIEEANRLRREVKLVADEYDVDWDETQDEGDEKVSEALRKERKKKEKQEDDEDDGKKKSKKEDDD